MRELRLARLWLTLGWVLVGLLVFFSLVPAPPEPPGFPGVDKIMHLSAYTLVMFWFGLIYLPGRRLQIFVLGFVLLGIVLEFIQGLTGYRSFDYVDMLSNTLGVSLGWVLAKSPVSNTLALVERRICHGADGE